MKVLVTGGAGFIGRRLVDVLDGDGHHVTVLSRRADRLVPPGTRLVHGDLASEKCPVVELVKGCEIVFHCAGETRDVAAMRALHVDGTRRLLKAVIHEATQAARALHWVQLSSVGAYGEQPGSPNADYVVTEDTPTRPVNEYEVTKTLSDEMLTQACRPGVLTTTVLRPSNVIGADMPNNSLRALGMMVRNGLFFYIGRPGAVATYVHVDDVVEVLRRAGTDPRAKGQVFNVSNDCSLEEMVEGIASALGVRSPWLRVPESVARPLARVASLTGRSPLTQKRISALVRRTSYPVTKLRRYLDFTPQIAVPRAVGEIVAPDNQPGANELDPRR